MIAPRKSTIERIARRISALYDCEDEWQDWVDDALVALDELALIGIEIIKEVEASIAAEPEPPPANVNRPRKGN